MGRVGLSARSDASKYVDFDPASILREVRSQRTFSDRFDAFSDMYVWALAAIVALTYLTSALYGTIFVLLGEGMPHFELQSAVWDLDAVLVFVLPVVLVAVFRLLIFLGPLGLSREQADWWLPLPIDRGSLLQRSLFKALGLGMCSSLFAGLLWLLAFFGTRESFDISTFAAGVLFFSLAGPALAMTAVTSQVHAAHVTAQRIANTVLGLAILGFAVLSCMQFIQGSTAVSVLELAAAALLNWQLWIIGAAMAFLVCLLLLAFSRPGLHFVRGASLRAAGEHQQQLAGLLMQADARAIGRRHRVPQWLKGLSYRLAGGLPAAYKVSALRFVRSGYWKAPAIASVSTLGFLLLVKSVANPLAACLFLAVLLAVLNSSLAEMIRPLLTQPELCRLLGLAPGQSQRASMRVSTLVAAGLLLLWLATLWTLGFGSEASWWAWGAGILLAALGLAASAQAHSQRGERDWGQLFDNAASEVNMSRIFVQEFTTLLRALASGAVLYFLLLAPASAVPLGIWAIAVLIAAASVKKLI